MTENMTNQFQHLMDAFKDKAHEVLDDSPDELKLLTEEDYVDMVCRYLEETQMESNLASRIILDMVVYKQDKLRTI